MANMTTQRVSDQSLSSDLILTRQGGEDVVVSKSTFLGATHPVGGQPLFLLSGTTPNTLGYPGTWVAMEANCTINSVAQSSSSKGTISGSNTKSVPLLSHAHNASFSGSQLPQHAHSTTTTTNTHHHIQGAGVDSARAGRYGRTNTGVDAIRDDDLSRYETHGRNTSTVSHSHAVNVYNNTAGTPSGTVSVSSTGESTPTLSVQGRALNLVIWIRTA